MELDCRTVLDWLLEADPAALAAEGDSPFAAHLRGCPRCRAAANAILRSQHALGRALDQYRPGLDAERAAAAAARAGRPRRRARWVPLSLAAAAGVAALMLLNLREQGGHPLERPAPETVAGGPLPLEALPNQNVVVFQTASVMVVWFYPKGD